MSEGPELNYLKFLEVIGIELNPATAAQAEITFPTVPTSPNPYVIVPLHTQVSAPGSSGGAPTFFSTVIPIFSLSPSPSPGVTYKGFIFTPDSTAKHHTKAEQ